MAKKKKIIDVVPATKALSQEKIDGIVDKDWAVAPLPSEEALANEQHESPKARSNINSRKNLVQYREDIPREVKEAIVSNLEFRHARKDKEVAEFFGDILSEKLVGLLLPIREALADDDEDDIFLATIKNFVSDFPKNELGVSDVDDIANLALNRILELRLLKETKRSPRRILDIAASIERFRKNSEKIKMSLASRRMDRIDTKNKGGVSIVDLVEQFDSTQRQRLQERADKYREEDAAFEVSKGQLVRAD